MSRSYTRSFAGGELSPQLFGRLDLTKFQTGLAKCLNFRVTPQGPVENRTGFEYVLKTKANGAVLIPFTYNSTQSFALEFGVGYIRFHTNGGTLLETAKAITGITQAAPGVFNIPAHGYAVGDWVYLAAIGGMTALNGRFAIVATVPDANHVTLRDLFGNAINTAALPAYTAGGTAARVYEIATTFAADDLFELHTVQSADVLTICHPNYAPQELRRLGATNWTLTAISFVPTISAPAGAPGLVGAGPGGGTPTDHTYLTTAVASGTLEESLTSAAAVLNYDLNVAGNSIEITTAVSTPAGIRYNVYEYQGGLYCYIGQTDGSVFVDNNITPDTAKTPPLPNNPFTGAGLYPGAVSYFEQRRCFGGSLNLPQNLWFTRSGTESNMSYSIPLQDDDSITARIVAREANTVRHLVPLGDLLALTSGGVWRVTSSNGDVLTPGSFSVRPQSYVGASNVQPIVTSGSVLYAPDRGAHIREITYKWESQAYQADDVSVLAPHLFDYKGIVQLAYARTPVQTLWAVRDDGVMLGLTHVPEHEVKAWYPNDTQGLFKSVCAVAEGAEDGVYAIVERQISGHTVQYIERLHTRQFSALEDCFFVDSGLSYDGAPTSTFNGLWHLEGKEVAILVDGGVSPPQTVVGGTVNLDAPASKVHVGLSYNADFQTMPLSLEEPGFGQGSAKNVNKVDLRVYQSAGVNAGPTFDKLRPFPTRTLESNYGAPPQMLTGVIELRLDPKWQENGQVCVRQSDPLPLSILAITVEAASGG